VVIDASVADRIDPCQALRMPDTGLSRRPRNDPGQYDDLVDEWWRPDGAFAMLHWLAEARAALLPPAPEPGALLVDLGCGGGLLAPHLAGRQYRHLGVDLVASGLVEARRRGVTVLRADAGRLPLPDGCAAAVSAGELLEHVPHWPAVVAETCRIMRPGGTVVLDTLADTALCRFVAVTLGERFPGGAPKGLHDPALFVAPERLVAEFARHGVPIRVRGIRPQARRMLQWVVTRRGKVPIVPTRSTAVLYQGWGRKL
jgi:2-polyprenyl-6-hydroxyphenyl methylase/3-demethylubiquinone-9 3-methyltransferase